MRVSGRMIRGILLGLGLLLASPVMAQEFIPTRDPEQYPVCEACKQVLTLLRGSGGN